MTRFLIRRIGQAILVLWAASVAVFLLFFVGPGQPGRPDLRRAPGHPRSASCRSSTPCTLTSRCTCSTCTGSGTCCRATWAIDYYKGQSVNTVVAQALPATASLVLGAAILWIAYGVFSGVISAVRSRSLLDRGFTTAALFFYSMPTFVLGYTLIFIFAYELYRVTKFFPFSSYVPITTDPWQWFVHLLLPWLTLAMVTAAGYTRLTRTSMLEVLGEDYIRTARSKGMPERRVIRVHGLRAALTPVVTLAGLDIGTALGGVIITEQVFGIPGLGWTIVQAIGQQDLPIIMGIAVLAATFVVVANVIVDILYAVLDPRVRLN